MSMRLSYIRHLLLPVLLLTLLLAAGNHVHGAPPSQEDPAKTLLEQAMAKYVDKAYADAIPLFQQLLDQYPDSEWVDEALAGLGMSYFLQGDYEKARTALQKLIDEYPDSEGVEPARQVIQRIESGETPSQEGRPRTLLDQAWAKYDAGIYADAIPLFQQFLDQYAGSKWVDVAQVGLGMSYLAQGDYEQAIAEFGKVLAEYPDSEYAPLALSSIGSCYYRLENWEQAKIAFQTLIDDYPDSEFTGDARQMMQRIESGEALLEQAMYKFDSEAYADAILLFRQFLDQHPDSESAEYAQVGLGMSYFEQGDYRQAIAEFGKVLTEYPNTEDVPLAQSYIVRCYYHLGDWEQAKIAFQTLAEDYPDSLFTYDARQVIQRINSEQLVGPSSEAEETVDALLNDENLSQEEKAQALFNMAEELYKQGEYLAALDMLEQSLEICEELDNPNYIASVVGNMGNIYRAMGSYSEAMAYHQFAYDICVETDNTWGQAAVLVALGQVARLQGKYQDALAYSMQAQRMFDSIGDLEGQANAFFDLALTYLRFQDFDSIEENLLYAASLYSQAGNRLDEGECFTALGHLHLTKAMSQVQRTGNAMDPEQFVEAIKTGGRYFKQADDILKLSAPYSQQYAALRDYLAGLYSILAWGNFPGMYEQALLTYLESLEISQGLNDKHSVAITYQGIGDLHLNHLKFSRLDDAFPLDPEMKLQLDDISRMREMISPIVYEEFSWDIYAELSDTELLRRAQDSYQEALSLASEVGDLQLQADILSAIGTVYEMQGQDEQALNVYDQAISSIELIRGGMTVDEIKTSFAARQMYVYDEVVSLLVRMGRPEEAFGYVQRAKARTFLDQLGNVRVDPLVTENPRLAEEETTLRGEIQALDTQLHQENTKPKDQQNDQVIQLLTARLETKREEYARLLQALKLSNPEYASLVTVDPLTLTDTQKILSSNTTLIEYFVTAEQTVAFVVTRDDFHAVQITVTQESLVENLGDFYLFPSLEGVPTSMKTLYQQLIAPLKPHIQTDLVCIVPHGVLHYLPFGAMYDGEHYLVEEYTLFYAPSASVLPFAFAKRKSSVAPPLVLGDPDGSLSHSREEAKAIAKLFGVSAYVGKDALERLMWERAKDAGILHLSTHGVYSARSPLFSRVLLAPDDEEDGNLEVYEIYNRGLNLANADLVVLSACQTDVGELSRGDEIVGLSRALIYAGAPSVVASLWSVSDESTRVLMEEFYTHLREGMSKAEALRQAQMEMIASEKYAHPYHWAAFEVVGDDGSSEIMEQAQQVIGRVATPTPVATTTGEKKGGGICPALALPLMLVGIVIFRRRS